eukprot:SAG11_NODE_1397_length_5032_cov_14.008109_8_plen_38_part_00
MGHEGVAARRSRLAELALGGALRCALALPAAASVVVQ